MKITSISQQVKNPERVSISVDGKYSFSLNLDQLLELKLKKGMDLSSEDVKYYQKVSSDGKVRARAFEWLLIRPHSEREFRDYLRRKKVDPEQVSVLIEDAKSKNLQNDESFAQWFFDQRQRKSRSTRAIIAELRAKGVSPVTIKSIVSSNDSLDREALQLLISKLSKRSKYINDPTKLKRYLSTKGFSFDEINEAFTIQPEQ